MMAQTLRSLAVGAALMLTAPVAAQEIDDAAPLPPTGVALTFVPPARDDAGYRTPNRALTPEETTWHVRVALNVAALGCRGPEEAATVAAYNALLKTDAPALAAAATAMEGQFKTRHGAQWQARYDDDMTRLYNFFAQPPAQAGFCETATALLRESAAVAPADFPAFAAAALPRLEAPFLTFFATFDAYRTSLAAWKTRHATVMIATASTPSVGPQVMAPAASIAPAAAVAQVAPATPVAAVGKVVAVAQSVQVTPVAPVVAVAQVAPAAPVVAVGQAVSVAQVTPHFGPQP